MTSAFARNSNALPPSSAVPAVGAASKRILGRNSDTETNASPFAAHDQRLFVARSIHREEYNGALRWRLADTDESTYGSDNRAIVLPDGDPLLAHIKAHNPQIEHFKNRDRRALYPRISCKVERSKLGPYRVTEWRELEMNEVEQLRAANRPLTERLYVLAASLDISRGECDNAIRRHQGRDDWQAWTEAALRARYVEIRRNERDYWCIDGRDANVYEQYKAEIEPVSDVDTWFGPKTAKRAPWGAESETIKVDRKPFSVFGHFRRELLKLRPDADPAAVALLVLGMTIEESCEKIGISPTIDKLQVYLDAKPEEITVTAIAAVPTFQNEVANLINEAFPLASSEYKQNVIATAIGHKTTTAAKVAGMDEVTILAAIRNEISTIKNLEKNLPPAETHAVDAASAPVAKHEATPVPPTPVGATAGKAEGPQGGLPTTFPNYPESPVVVYPMDRGGIVYQGIRFSVTMRLGGSWKQAMALMEEFAAHRECIDPSCLVRVPMQTAATGGSTAPRDEDAPPDDDSEPQFLDGGNEEHENGTAIMRSVEGNKTTYTIWYNVGSGAETKWPKKISNPQGLKLLETALRAAGRNPDKWESGKRYNSVKVNVWWKQGKLIEGTDKHFIDYTRFEVVKEVEEVPA